VLSRFIQKKAEIPMNIDTQLVSDFLYSTQYPSEVLREVENFKLDLAECLKLNANDLKNNPELKALKTWVNGLAIALENKSPAILLEKNHAQNISLNNFRKLSVLVGHAFGDLLVQNEQGDRLITVYDRDRTKSMHQGARYHQTREGGSIHTDNVNIPERWHYLLLTCLEKSPVGGESIIVDGRKVYESLKKDFPESLRTLEQDFWWEKRGVADALYRAPIITYENGRPLFRHLRPYMESAHRKANEPMTDEQSHAVDVLDALLNATENQVRYYLSPYQILLTVDSEVLHGRQCFADDLNAVDLPTYLASNDSNLKLKRTMERLWIKA
jgi:alpha-ketoglutarate-dependent taurine dioxygenase